jgi:hypothetical protein
MAQRVGRREIIGQPLALRLGGCVPQPHQQEKRHYGGHEIGVRHLPRAAMTAALDNLLAPDDHVAAIARLPLPLILPPALSGNMGQQV